MRATLLRLRASLLTTASVLDRACAQKCGVAWPLPLTPVASLPGLTRKSGLPDLRRLNHAELGQARVPVQSILFGKASCEGRWTRGSSPRVTREVKEPLEVERIERLSAQSPRCGRRRDRGIGLAARAARAGAAARGLPLLDERAQIAHACFAALGRAHGLLDHHEAAGDHARVRVLLGKSHDRLLYAGGGFEPLFAKQRQRVRPIRFSHQL